MLPARTIFVLVLAACASFAQQPRPRPVRRHPPPGDPVMLLAPDVAKVVAAAASSVNSEAMVIAVTNRQGNILAIYSKPSAPATSLANFGQPADTKEVAVALARTASFFSNDQAPLSSRTVRFISGIHFPPGIAFTSNAPLYGIENTNRGCPFNADYIPGQGYPPARSIDGSQPGLGILTGKADLNDSDPTAVNPGGVPLFKQGVVVGGVGVAGVTPDVAEFAALSGAVGAGFGPTPPPPGFVVVGGLALPFVNQKTMPAGYSAGSADGQYLLGPFNSPSADPEGDLVAPRAGPIGGLTQDEVQRIIDTAVAEANQTRAVIRLPVGSRARFVIAVADLDGTVIALHRMPDATIFSIDVAVAKSRNVIFFSGPDRKADDLPGVPMGTAVTNRTLGFGGQPIYPPGVTGSAPGPFFSLYQFDTLHPCTQGSQAANPNQNGIVFFPGALPLYKNGVMVGGLGISGDGVDQDDFVTAAAGAGFEAPANIRADQIIDQGVRLPYLKFPQNPTY
ncbi:MAG TPA: heme-binding protein [Bryobacteraceae bacterium]|nr:heme-binding protein [Bryobacteraceae bacterium]